MAVREAVAHLLYWALRDVAYDHLSYFIDSFKVPRVFATIGKMIDQRYASDFIPCKKMQLIHKKSKVLILGLGRFGLFNHFICSSSLMLVASQSD